MATPSKSGYYQTYSPDSANGVVKALDASYAHLTFLVVPDPVLTACYRIAVCDQSTGNLLAFVRPDEASSGEVWV